MSEGITSQWRQLIRFRTFDRPQLTTLADPAIAVGGFPTSVAVTPSGLSGYVTNEDDNTVSVISTATNTVIATIPVGSVPFWAAVSPDGLSVYVTNSGGNTVSVISTATNTVTTTIPVGSVPLGIAVAPSGLLAYVANSADGTVSVISTVTNTLTATIPVGTAPFGVAIAPNGLLVYVTNSGGNTVSVISTATNTVTATIPVGTAPFGVAVTPDGLYAYVANNGDNTVSVISTATNTVTATVPVGSAPLGVAIAPSGLSAYVTNNGDNTVSVIDTTTHTISGSIPVGAAPFGVAIAPSGLSAYVANNGDNTVSVTTTAPFPTTTALTSAPDPSALGQPKTLTATVTPVPPGGGTPTGTVSFFDGVILLGAGILTGGVATLTTSVLTVGSHPLTAVYTGDTNFTGSTSPVDTQTVTQAATTTALTSAPDPSVFGQPKTLTATVTPVPPGLGIPIGTVSFFDGATFLGTGIVIGGVATFITSTLTVGSHALTAVYSGDVNFTGSTSPVDTQTVTQAATTTTLTSAPDPSLFGQPKILTATVTPVPPGLGLPTGAVSFFDGATLLGTGTLVAGIAVLTTSALAVGSHALTAVYSGSGSFTGSTSPVDTQTVTQAATATVLTSAPDPAVFGQTKTLTATVTPVLPGGGTPTGTVSFFDGVTLLGTATVIGGVATLITSALTVGSHALTAVYSGSGSFTASTSPVDTQTVTQAATATVLTSAPDPAVFGQTKTLTATVTPVLPGGGTPTGTVSFFDGVTLLGTATVIGGVATLITSALTVGSHALTAVYSGSGSFTASTSPVDTQTVTQAATATVLTSAPDPAVFGQTKTLTATVTPVLPGGGTPTGTVSFFDGVTLLGTATVIGGVATLTTSALTVGSHALTAVYSGSGSFTASTSPVDVQTVSKANTTTSLTSAPDPSTFGQPKTLTATVMAAAPATGTPIGTVSFFDGAILLGTASLIGGTATLNTAALTVGSHSLTAVYSGSGSFNASTSPVDVQTVSKANTTTALTSAPDPSVFGQPKTLTATVTPVLPATGTPIGTVSFFDGITLLGTASLVGGVATLNTAALTVGSHSLTAVYSGSGSFNPSTSPVDIQTVSKANTTTALTSGPDPSAFGQAKTLTATVAPVAPGSGAPSGTVSFFDGATLLGTGTLTGGVATLTTAALAVGAHALTAVYNGSVGFTASTSPVDIQTVNKANTTTALTSAPNPSTVGQPVVLTAAVAPVAPGSGAPTGTVSFFDGATLLGTGTLTGGVATLTTSALALGPHALTAVYSGSASYNASTSPAITQTVTNTSPVATKLTATPASATIGLDGLAHIGTLKATLTVLSSGVPVPGQTITFKVGTTTLGTGVTNASGVAQLSNTTISPQAIILAGSRFTATFAGTAGFGPATTTAPLVLA
ncbi:Ig-like domain repeat protein [Streptomyces sp. NBC_01190]|uniref:Ig-like domain repeat protein n=1 Tax=Streptomyces sp. NBC_01190 TaxID=2903767 RepID=UPI00386E46B4|nr:Ig-like domain repeat protein [Streptomyces sp. NBC_01190]